MNNGDDSEMMHQHLVKEHFSQESKVTAWTVSEEGLVSRREHEYVLEQFSWDGKKVLDVGVGGGRFALPISLRGADVYGVDLSLKMLQAVKIGAEKAGVEVGVYQADIDALPFKDESFDIVLSMATIMYFPRPEKALLEMSRVVKPGGHVIIGTNNKLSVAWLGAIHTYLYHILKRKQATYRPYSPWQFRSFFEDTGLEIVQIKGIGLIFPETSIPITKEISIPIFPKLASEWFLKNIEFRFELGKGPLSNFMKYMIAISTKKELNQSMRGW
ncbi:MAG: class I SAM-dependent methyltransferase [Halobacteriota archaeon]|nr:class I SAM-dependent methyltransferase [Halobacteriota archaeon]